MVAVGLWAQTEGLGEQVLVFRNTGEVNFFYTNTLDSVTCSCLDADSVLHEDVVSQVFWSQDTVMVVPLAEIDSIAIGERNVMEFHKDVKTLTRETDLPWIIRFDGQSIYYRTNTPSSILPKKGTKLFYALDGDRDGIFPYGLCAKVTGVATLSDEIKIDIEAVKLEDIFSRLFLAGPIYTETDASSSRRRAPVNASISLNSSLKLGDLGSVYASGKVKVTGNAVIKLGYQHADLTFNYGYSMGLKLQAKESTSYHLEELGPDAQIGTFYGLLFLDAAAGAFADMAAELSFGMDIERTYSRRLQWTRRGDENSFDFHDVGGDEPYEDKAHYDLTLDGRVFFGPMLQIDFVTIGEVIGARAKVKAGTEIEGKISLGILEEMRNYEQQAYGNAELSFRGKVALEGYTVNRSSLIWGGLDEHKIFSLPLTFGGHTMRLFPEYTQSTATVAMPRTEGVDVSVGAGVERPTPTDLETGFEIVNAQGEVVDSVFVGTIESKPEDTTTAQAFDTVIALPDSIKREDMEGYTMRPIFRYAGHTISAAPVGIRKDVLLQPYTSFLCNGSTAFISSGPFMDSQSQDGTLYHVGAYMPVPLKQSVFKGRRTTSSVIIIVGNYVGSSDALVGTWEGVLNGEEITLALLDDGTGNYNNDRTFEYQLNNPQSGDLHICFDDGGTLVFCVLSISDTKLTVIDKRDKTHTVCILTRKG